MSTSESLETETPTAPSSVGAKPAVPDTPASVGVATQPLHIAFSGVLTIIGAVLGYRAADWYIRALNTSSEATFRELASGRWAAGNLIAVTVIGMLLGFLLASITFRQIVAVVPRIEQLPVEDKVAGLFGVILGLIVAVLLQPLLNSVPTFGAILVVATYVFAVSAGVLFTISMKKELVGMFARSSAVSEEDAKRLKAAGARPKLLDTNVIIDGRILDVWNSGFIEGELLVPQFVLDELQLIADSADDLKRARGRRGLELLNRMKDDIAGFRVLRPRDYGVSVNDVDGVDQKLIRVATHMEAALVTNDFNLNRVADVQGIPVLNVNRLALSLKPVVIAGEEMTVHIIRAGRDPGQGVAYLDDGTMVVVEDGETKIGRTVDVEVSSLLQTVAGKMIFAHLRDGGHGGRSGGHSR